MLRRDGVRTAQFAVIAIAIIAISSSPIAASTSAQFIDIGNAFMDTGRYQEALNAFDKAIEIDPDNSNAWENKGIALNNLGRNQEAFEALVKALELNPDNLNALVHKGYTLDALGRRQEAIAVAYEVINKSDRLIATDPNDTDAWLHKGSFLSFLGKNDEAITALNKAISINPNNPHTWFTKGNVLLNSGKYQEALNAIDEAIKVNPNLSHFWRSKGDALKALGKYQEANEAYNKAYELTTTASAPSNSASRANDLFSEGLKYFSVMGLTSLIIIGIILLFEKRGKNEPKFRDDLKTKHWFGYYSVLICHFIIGAILALISLEIAFKELPFSFDTQKFFFAIPFFYLSLSSFILIVGLLASKPIIKLNTVHFLVSLIIGMLLIIALGDPKTPVFLPFLPLISAGLSFWYGRIAILRPESIQKSLSVEKDTEKSIPVPYINRGYAVLPNNDIKFGIRVTNDTGYTVTDVDTILDCTEELFNLKESKIQRIGTIPPNGARTATYILKPLGCIHNEQINALITYKDHTGKKQTLHMRPKEIHCVCPFVKEKPMSEGEYSRLAANSEFIQEGISFEGISIEDLGKFMGETCKHMLYKVKEYDLEGKKVIYLSGEALGERTYYLLTAVIQDYKRLTQVILRAHSDKKYGLNGFMNEMADSIRHLVGSVQSAKEIGIIENTQVINIIDSVVQRTSFNMGEGGNAHVSIRDSLIQHTDFKKKKEE
ncbi:MAG: tetratricopeptide repeat protein [Candidatus Methanoperedens sp.]|nr:tetratricopeptide repeat protein [Candidatus Methanoperedens sp.]